MSTPTNQAVVGITAVLQLRLLVGGLGEKSRFGWWQTSFFDKTSQAFLTPVFVKTFSLACYHGAVEAARLVHDEGLNAGSYHLFRLPEEMEQDLHAAMSGRAAVEILGVTTNNADGGLTALRDFAGHVKSTRLSSGPFLLGTMSEFNNPMTLQRMARAYFDGFSAGLKPIPYLTGTA